MTTSHLAIRRVVPTLRIFDVAKAKEFYVDYLGCMIDAEHRVDANAPLFMQVSLGALVLHLSEHYGDASPGAAVTVEVTGLSEFHAHLATKNYRYLRPGLEKTDWGTLRVTLIDPFGNRLHLDERVES